MRWIAIATTLWGLVLTTIDTTVPGITLLVLGVVGLVVTGLPRVAARIRAHRPVSPVQPIRETRSVRVAIDSDSDLALLDLYWNFRRIEDVAALAGRRPDRVQARLIELLLEPEGVAMPLHPGDADLTPAERERIVHSWEAGESLSAVAQRTAHSTWVVGQILLEYAPQPLGLAA